MRRNPAGSAESFEPLDDARDLLTTVSQAVRGDRQQRQALLARVKQRAQERLDGADAPAGLGPAGWTGWTGRIGTAVPVGARPPAAADGVDAAQVPGAPVARRPLAMPVPAAAPGPVRLRLRNGRTVRVTLSPQPARRSDLAALARATETNDRRAFVAIDSHGRAIEELMRSQQQLAAQVAELQEQSDAALAGLLNGIARLRREAGAAAQTQQHALAVERRTSRLARLRQQRALRTQAVSAQLQKVTGTVNALQVAAFGEKGTLLSTNNLLLAGNQALWGFIDPLLKFFGLHDGPGPSTVAWLAPLGTLLTGQAVLGRRQTVRFVSGVATIDLLPGGGTATVSLRDFVAPAFFSQLASRTNVPATAVALDLAGDIALSAQVQSGLLTIRASVPGGTPGGGTPIFAATTSAPLRVAWMIDTGVGDG